MSLPVVVSPYVRAYLEGTRVVYDNGITGAVHRPGPVGDEVLRALWDRDHGGPRLDAVMSRHGAEAVGDAVADLAVAGLLFDSEAAAHDTFDAVLDARLPRVPFIDQVEITNVCPMRCGFCPRGIPGHMKRPTGRMSDAVFDAVLGQLHPHQARYRPLELHHLGESLTHPRLPEFIARATARGIPTELSVNPSLLTPALARAIIDAGVTRLVVSLDGVDNETLAAIRGPAAKYDRAARNLDALLDLVEASDAPPTVVIQMIDLQRNRHQREAFLTRWTRDDLPGVHTFVKDLDGPDPDTGVSSDRPQTQLCTYPWRSVVVLWDGRVVPCCRDDDARLVLGNIAEQSLEDIWNGPAARILREQHRAGTVPPGHLCAECPWSRDRFVASMARRHPREATANPLAW